MAQQDPIIDDIINATTTIINIGLSEKISILVIFFIFNMNLIYVHVFNILAKFSTSHH